MLRDHDRFEWNYAPDISDGRPVPIDDLGDARPSLLLIAPAGEQPQIAAIASGAGFRLLGTVDLPEMAQRLRQTVGADALLVDLRGLEPNDLQLGRAMASLLGWPGWSDARPILLVDLAMLEPVAGTWAIGFDRLLCDARACDVAAALCHAARSAGAPARLHDIDREADVRLEELSAEVRRLAETIDRLARAELGEAPMTLRDREQDYAAPPAGIGAAPDRGRNATRAEVRTLLQARRLRERFLPGDLFADPAWDMMLDLMAARLDGKLVSVSSLCIAAAVPPTTALRWIAQLTERGIFERRNDPHDARRVFISLSDEAADNLSRWFAAAQRAGVRFSD